MCAGKYILLFCYVVFVSFPSLCGRVLMAGIEVAHLGETDEASESRNLATLLDPRSCIYIPSIFVEYLRHD